MLCKNGIFQQPHQINPPASSYTLRHRQPESECTSFARLTAYPNAASHGFHNFFTDRQPYSGALLICSARRLEISLENSVQIG